MRPLKTHMIRAKPYSEGLTVPLVSESSDTHEICSICLSNDQFTYKSWVQLHHCPHSFHRHCIDLWLESKQTCPVCLHNVYTSNDNVVRVRDIMETDAYPCQRACLSCAVVMMCTGVVGILIWLVVYAFVTR